MVCEGAPEKWVVGALEAALWTTQLTLDDGSVLDAFALAHRRGGEVHTFISTCGTTMLGNPQKHKDDDLDAETGHILARKCARNSNFLTSRDLFRSRDLSYRCPQVLNDATKAQPKIDQNNKKRQYALAMEKRFVTHSFPFRNFIFFLGKCFVDTFNLHMALNKEDIDFKAACKRMFFAMLLNNRKLF